MKNRIGIAMMSGFIGVGLMLSSAARAQTSTRSGTVASIFLSGAHNYAFRVTLKQNGTDQLSACRGSFAYINGDDDNYQAYVAALTTLYVRGTPVTITITPDANTFCHLIEFGTQ